MAYRIKLHGTTLPTFDVGINKVTLNSGAVVAPYTWTFPVDAGVAEQVLKTDGAGNLYWATGASADSTVPYFIPSAETFTVALNRQALFAIPIETDGTLTVDGVLVEVN